MIQAIVMFWRLQSRGRADIQGRRLSRKKLKVYEYQNKTPLSNGKKINTNNRVWISFPANYFLFGSGYKLFMEWFTAPILVSVNDFTLFQLSRKGRNRWLGKRDVCATNAREMTKKRWLDASHAKVNASVGHAWNDGASAVLHKFGCIVLLVFSIFI